MNKFFITVLVSFITYSAFAGECTITGKVLNRNSKALVLRKCSESSKTLYENPVKIHIKKNQFIYTFSYSDTEAYELVFEDELKKGVWKPVVFFPVDGTIRFVLYPFQQWDSNVIEGGDLNAEYAAYKTSRTNLFDNELKRISSVRDSLMKNDEFESQEYKALRQQLSAIKLDDYDARTPIYQKMDEMQKTWVRYTDKAIELVSNPQDSLNKAQMQWKYNYINDNPSIVSYYLVWTDVEMEIKNNAFTARLVADAFPLLEKKYPDHIYTKKIKDQLVGLRTIAPGYTYIDFSAPSVDGETLTLSDLISGKIALIDLWGSWCGPCIAKSRLVVPIYEKYKRSGFKVVGIAREFKSTDAVKRRLTKEQFSWVNLVELDDKQNIWNLYGISNGTGLMVLVDRNGIILAVDPKPDELEKILQEKL